MSQEFAQYKSEWDKIVSEPVDEQANNFLKAYIHEFAGDKFQEVLDIGSNFKKYLRGSDLCDLEEDRAHLFLEKRGETLTVATLREYLKEIDVDNNHRVAFLEYCLWKYQKNVLNFFKELHTPKAGGGAALQAAIDAYRKVLAVREAREKKMEQLAETAKLGGVKGNAALHELEAMKAEDELEQRKKEITAAAAKRKAEKNSADPFEEEKKRLEEEKKKQEAEEKAKRDAGRAKLAEKAALWNQK